MEHVNTKGLRLARIAEGSRRLVLAREQDLYRAKCASEAAQQDLIKWLVPDDAKIGETFCMPIGDAFLEVYIDSAEMFPVGADNPVTLVPKFVIRWRNNRQPSGEGWQ